MYIHSDISDVLHLTYFCSTRNDVVILALLCILPHGCAHLLTEVYCSWETRRFGSATILCSQVLCAVAAKWKRGAVGSSFVYSHLSQTVMCTGSTYLEFVSYFVWGWGCLKLLWTDMTFPINQVTEYECQFSDFAFSDEAHIGIVLLFSALSVVQTTWHRMIECGRKRSWHFKVLWRYFEVLWQNF